MSFSPTILFSINLNNSNKKNHSILNNIINFYKLNYNIKIIYLDNDYHIHNSWSITERMLIINKSFFTNMFNLYELPISSIYKQSDIHKRSDWKKEYNIFKSDYPNYSLNNLCTMSDIKIIETECYLVNKIDDTNIFLSNQVSRIEYEII